MGELKGLQRRVSHAHSLVPPVRLAAGSVAKRLGPVEEHRHGVVFDVALRRVEVAS